MHGETRHLGKTLLMSGFFLLVFIFLMQGCHTQPTFSDENPRFLARSTPERSTTGILHDWNEKTPFSPRPVIQYFLADSTDILLILERVDGNLIDTLVNVREAPGVYEVLLRNDSAPSGVYIYKLYLGEYVTTQKRIIMR